MATVAALSAQPKTKKRRKEKLGPPPAAIGPNYLRLAPGESREVTDDRVWRTFTGHDRETEIAVQQPPARRPGIPPPGVSLGLIGPAALNPAPVTPELAVLQALEPFYFDAVTDATVAGMRYAAESAIRLFNIRNYTNHEVVITVPEQGQLTFYCTASSTGSTATWNHPDLLNAHPDAGQFNVTHTNTSSTISLTFDNQLFTTTTVPSITPQDVVKSAVRNNLNPTEWWRRSRQPLDKQVSLAEEKARRTLRDLLTEKAWRRYVTNGFIMVRGASGKWYQIFNNSSRRIQVFENNKLVSLLCIHTDSTCPPTDHVINCKILIEVDEELIYKASNPSSPGTGIGQVSLNQLPVKSNLVKAFKETKIRFGHLRPQSASA